MEIKRPEADPSRGFVNLPTQVVDASTQLAQSCPSAVAQGESKFIITGRGGLPPSPTDPLTGEAVLTDWATLDSDAENRTSAAPSTNSTSTAPTQIVEAQGWIVNEKGEVVLTAAAPTLDIPWVPKSDCNAPKPSS